MKKNIFDSKNLFWLIAYLYFNCYFFKTARGQEELNRYQIRMRGDAAMIGVQVISKLTGLIFRGIGFTK